jgi:hypothetical protein
LPITISPSWTHAPFAPSGTFQLPPLLHTNHSRLFEVPRWQSKGQPGSCVDVVQHYHVAYSIKLVCFQR